MKNAGKALTLGMALIAAMAWGQDLESRWVVHYTRADGGFLTQLHLINTDFETAQTANLVPYASDGTELTDLVQSIEVAPGHRLVATRDSLGWTDQPVSHLRVEAPASLRTSAAYRQLDENAMPAEVTLAVNAATQARFVPVGGANWFDGAVVVNPGEEPVAVHLSAHDAMGNSLQTREIALNPKQKWLAVLSQVFDGLEETPAYVQMNASQAVFFLVLRGSLGGIEPGVLTEVRPDTFAAAPTKLTYANQVSRILQRHCTSCHHDGGIGPFPLTSFADVDSLKGLIAFEVGAGNMPPWKASEHCENLKGSMAMEPAERDMLLRWIQEGAAAGEAERVPPAQEFPAGDWSLGQPDVVVEYPEPFFFEAGPDQYRCFPVQLRNAENMQIQAVEVLPGNASIVHHVLVFIEDNTNGLDLDMMEEGPGYTCFGGPGTGGFRLIAGWAPGMTPTVLPETVGMTLPANATAVVQVHYNYSFTEGSDRTRIGLYLTEEEREHEMLLLPIVNQSFLIPPGAKNHQVTESFTLPPFIEADLYLVAPHMHLLGQNISLDADFPDGTGTCLIDIPKWDFDWQRFYEFPAPIHLPPLTTLSMNAFYDNSSDNPFNPNDPPVPVGWGEATTDEMALVFLGLVSPAFDFILNGKADFGGWQWPYTIKSAPGDPFAVKESLRLKRKVKSCCSQVAAAKNGTVCPNNTPLSEGQ